MNRTVRLRFAKLGKLRWTSHRDVVRMWERAFRRVRLPLAYTGGFSPRPKMSLGLALPTGYESLAEYLDVDLDPAQAGADIAVADLPALLSPALPDGIDVLAAAEAPAGGPSLQQQVISCQWEVVAAGAGEEQLRSLVDRALAADTLVITRERKGTEVTDDIRPAILALAVTGPAGAGTLLDCRLAAQPRALRPSELLGALGAGLTEVGVRRTHQWIECDGATREVLPLDATDAPPALERVS